MTRASVLLAALVLVGGCGGRKQLAGDRISGRTLTIYSSMPLRGPSSVEGEAVLNGARLALAEIHGRIGRYRIVFKPLDDSTVARDGWDPVQTSQNARLAVADRTTIGYLGELDSGASAISIPVLNRAGIPQISPTSAAVGLTSGAAGASPGEPQKYYPTGRRTFARVVPNDAVQASAQMQILRSAGCRRPYVLQDGEVDGEDAAMSFELAAQAARMAVVGVGEFDPAATDYRSLAVGIAQSGAGCVMISADPESHAVLLSQQLAAAAPTMLIVASAGLADATYTDPSQGGIPLSLDSRVLISGPPEPYAMYGYEAMSLLLDAVSRATDHGARAPERSAVTAAIFATRDRRSVLGTYSIDRNGDTTLRRYGIYRILEGQLTLWRAVDG